MYAKCCDEIATHLHYFVTCCKHAIEDAYNDDDEMVELEQEDNEEEEEEDNEEDGEEEEEEEDSDHDNIEDNNME